MAQFKTLMDVFKLLEKSNCRECEEKTCLAFAAAVFGGRRPLTDCPRIPEEIAQQYGDRPEPSVDPNQELEAQLAELKASLKGIDFAEAAPRIGADLDGDRLVLKIMGRLLRVDGEGRIFTDLHVNPWMAAPVINYILHCQGRPVSGRWVPLRELPNGRDWYRLFGQRCEKPMKKVADTRTDLFTDLVDLFNGQPPSDSYPSDVAVVLQPLPLVPLLICYWHPEDDMASNLNLFFDASAEDNLGIEGIYALGAGITRMFERLALRHGNA